MLDAFKTPKVLIQKGGALLTGLLTVASLSLVPASQVEAKKFGGGMSIGKSAPVKKAPPPAAAQSANTPAKPNPAQTPAAGAPAGQAAAAPAAAGAAGKAAGSSTRSSWMGPLVGIAAGLGLAALASHLGLGEELMSLLLIVLFVVAAIFLVRLVMGRGRASSGMPEPAMARSSSGYSAGSMSGGQWSSQPEMEPRSESAQRFDQSAGSQPAQPEHSAYEPAASAGQGIAQDDIDAFLHVARQQFMAMQKLWDSGDLGQIEAFCTPEMSHEIRRQLEARGDAPNQTSVVQLDLEWLGLESATDDEGVAVEEAYIRFYGLVREESNGTASAFDEVWLLQKPVDGASGWLLAGITQQGGQSH
jgi:predicted lipid-binding transport protein (Tim44 family)